MAVKAHYLNQYNEVGKGYYNLRIDLWIAVSMDSPETKCTLLIKC